MALLSGRLSQQLLAPCWRPRGAGPPAPLTAFARRYGATRRDTAAAVAGVRLGLGKVTRQGSSLRAGAALGCSAEDDGCRDEGAVTVRDDLDSLLQVLPPGLRQLLSSHPRRSELVEVVLDLGRSPEVRGANGYREVLRADEVTALELETAQKALGNFGGDNRAGIEGAQRFCMAARD